MDLFFQFSQKIVEKPGVFRGPVCNGKKISHSNLIKSRHFYYMGELINYRLRRLQRCRATTRSDP